MKDGRRLVGHVGVDSGQVMICDPCYIDSTWEFDSQQNAGDEAKDFLAYCKKHGGKFNYIGACAETLSENQAGQFWLAVASSSGYGDGEYPVFATYKNGRVQKLEIIFF